MKCVNNEQNPYNQFYDGIGFVDYYLQIVNKPMRCLTEFYPKCLIQTFYYFSILEILPDILISKFVFAQQIQLLKWQFTLRQLPALQCSLNNLNYSVVINISHRITLHLQFHRIPRNSRIILSLNGKYVIILFAHSFRLGFVHNFDHHDFTGIFWQQQLTLEHVCINERLFQ